MSFQFVWMQKLVHWQIYNFGNLVFVIWTFGCSLCRFGANLVYIPHIWLILLYLLVFHLWYLLYTSKLYSVFQSVFIAFQWFSSIFISSYLFNQYGILICNLYLLLALELFCIIKFNLQNFVLTSLLPYI